MRATIDKELFKTLNFKQKFWCLWGLFLTRIGYLKFDK